MAIKVHGSVNSTATMRVLACLSEKELDYEFVPIDMKAGEHKEEPFISLLQPYGQVPAFEDGDLKLFGKFMIFFHFYSYFMQEKMSVITCIAESRAINQYIVHTYTDSGTQLVCKHPRKMAFVFVWSEVESQKYEPPAFKLTWELFIKPMLGMSTDDGIVEEQEAELNKVLDAYEDRLAQSKYLGGDCFTLADLHHLPTLEYLMTSRIKAVFDSHPHVRTWIADIIARPAWQKVVAMKNKQ